MSPPTSSVGLMGRAVSWIEHSTILALWLAPRQGGGKVQETATLPPPCLDTFRIRSVIGAQRDWMRDAARSVFRLYFLLVENEALSGDVCATGGV